MMMMISSHAPSLRTRLQERQRQRLRVPQSVAFQPEPASVSPIPTRYMKRQMRLKGIFGRLTILNVALIFGLLSVLGLGYAWKVSVSRRLEAQTAQAKNLYEENRGLEVALNRLKSFERIDQRLATVPDLVSAQEKRLVQSSPEDWEQPLLLGEQTLARHPEYKPMTGF